MLGHGKYSTLFFLFYLFTIYICQVCLFFFNKPLIFFFRFYCQHFNEFLLMSQRCLHFYLIHEQIIKIKVCLTKSKHQYPTNISNYRTYISRDDKVEERTVQRIKRLHFLTKTIETNNKAILQSL